MIFFNDFANAEATSTAQVDYFLRDQDTNIQMRNRYPQIRSLFIKYNTTIPTSAPVKRLFSQAAFILTARRNRLADALLEMLILLEMNLKLQYEHCACTSNEIQS